MTRVEILALVGRDLDAAVAEKVMDWTWEFVNHMDGYGEFKLWTPPDKAREVSVPLYSTDRNAAALVLQEITRLGRQSNFLENFWDLHKDRTFEERVGDAGDWLLLAASPRDLCRAALLSVCSESGE